MADNREAGSSDSQESRGFTRGRETVDALRAGAEASQAEVDLPATELPASQSGQVDVSDSLGKLAVRARLRGMQSGADAGYNEAVSESQFKHYARQVETIKKQEKGKTWFRRGILALGALGIGAASLFGINRGAKTESIKYNDHTTGSNGPIMPTTSEKGTEYVADGAGTNARVVANFESRNKVDGLDGVSEDEASKTSSEGVNQDIKDNNAADNDSGLKTENLE